MVLEIFNNQFVNSTFKNTLEYKFEYKLGGFNTWELVPEITDYKLVYDAEIQNFGWNSVYRDFSGRKILEFYFFIYLFIL